MKKATSMILAAAIQQANALELRLDNELESSATVEVESLFFFSRIESTLFD